MALYSGAGQLFEAYSDQAYPPLFVVPYDREGDTCPQEDLMADREGLTSASTLLAGTKGESR
jgi:hypothetical protein